MMKRITWPCLALAVAVLAAVADRATAEQMAPAAIDVKPLVAALAASDEAKAAAAREKLGAAGEGAVAPLIAILTDAAAPAPQRKAAAAGLAAVGRPATGAVVKLLIHPDAGVRAAAACTLGRIGDPAIVLTLAKALNDRDAAVRLETAKALGDLRDVQACGALATAHTKDASPEVRAAAALALGRLRCRASIEPLIEGLRDAQPAVRASAAEALGLLAPLLVTGARGELGRLKAVDALIATLKDADPTVRLRTVETLGLMKENMAAAPLAGVLGETALRPAAIRSLGQIGSLQARKILEEVVETSPDEAARRAAAAAIAEMRKRP